MRKQPPHYDFYRTARENEPVFRNVLRDLEENREKRPMRSCIPEDLKPEARLWRIFWMYSRWRRDGKFTITEFTRERDPIRDGDFATITYEKNNGSTCHGAQLEYRVNRDDSVKYEKRVFVILS